MSPYMGSRSTSERVILVIPARLASTRLPEKPLADIHGKPMIQWVYEQAIQVRNASQVLVATDHERVAERVRAFGGQVLLTDPAIASGTDRVAAVADQVEGDFFLNVQGDEPAIDPRAIEAAIEWSVERRFPIVTLMTPLQGEQELRDPACVKVITDARGQAIYFSRFAIPYSRGALPESPSSYVCRKHLGIYGYDRSTLMKFRALPAGDLERAESLEQLRALHAGIPIGVRLVECHSPSVDTPEDLERVRKVLHGKK